MKLSASVYNACMTASFSAILEKLNCPLYENFNYEGWALPCRSTFPFNKEQKTIVAVFYGWWTGWEETPDKVHMLLRNKLQPKDYVTSQHIKSLFSCWTKEFKNGKSLVSEATDTPLNEDAIEVKNDCASLI